MSLMQELKEMYAPKLNKNGQPLNAVIDLASERDLEWEEQQHEKNLVFLNHLKETYEQ